MVYEVITYTESTNHNARNTMIDVENLIIVTECKESFNNSTKSNVVQTLIP